MKHANPAGRTTSWVGGTIVLAGLAALIFSLIRGDTRPSQPEEASVVEDKWLSILETAQYDSDAASTSGPRRAVSARDRHASSHSISGTVVTDNGEVVEGTVFAWPEDMPPQPEDVRRRAAFLHTASFVSNQRFTIDMGEHAQSGCIVAASATGWVSATQSLTQPPVDDVRLTLQPVVGAALRIVDSRGMPPRYLKDNVRLTISAGAGHRIYAGSLEAALLGLPDLQDPDWRDNLYLYRTSSLGNADIALKTTVNAAGYVPAATKIACARLDQQQIPQRTITLAHAQPGFGTVVIRTGTWLTREVGRSYREGPVECRLDPTFTSSGPNGGRLNIPIRDFAAATVAVEHVPAGVYSTYLTNRLGWTTPSVTCNVIPDQTTEVTLFFDTPAALRILDADAPHGADYEVRGMNGNARFRFTKPPYVLPAVTPGMYSIHRTRPTDSDESSVTIEHIGVTEIRIS